MKKQIIIGTLLFLISLAGTATAQTISGKVTDAEAHPIDGATVILQSIDSTFVDALITDSTGCFRFNRQPAQYRLIFQHIYTPPANKKERVVIQARLSCQAKTIHWTKW